MTIENLAAVTVTSHLFRISIWCCMFIDCANTQNRSFALLKQKHENCQPNTTRLYYINLVCLVVLLYIICLFLQMYKFGISFFAHFIANCFKSKAILVSKLVCNIILMYRHRTSKQIIDYVLVLSIIIFLMKFLFCHCCHNSFIINLIIIRITSLDVCLSLCLSVCVKSADFIWCVLIAVQGFIFKNGFNRIKFFSHVCLHSIFKSKEKKTLITETCDTLSTVILVKMIQKFIVCC